MKFYTGVSVFEAALNRIYALYQRGSVAVSFSAGKDSTIVLSLAVIAAERAGRLPVHVILRDEEIMFPGTYEYAERVAQRKDLDFHWVIANQPIINIFNRKEPYFWVFDPELPPDKWTRQPPSYAYHIEDKNIEVMNIPARFGEDEAGPHFALTGLRAQESRTRAMSIYSKRGYVTVHPNKYNVFTASPIYDWQTGDVWKFIKDYKIDYNHAYDVMYRVGFPQGYMRIAPPTMTVASTTILHYAQKAWPRWFDVICERLPGVRTAAQFGSRAVKPLRRSGETWQQCFNRTCIEEAPEWIRERALIVRDKAISRHEHSSSGPFPESVPLRYTGDMIGCWKDMAMVMFNGDPFAMKIGSLINTSEHRYVEPEYFRPGTGTWNGKPTW